MKERIFGTVCLVTGAFFALMFVALLVEGGDPAADAPLPLFLAVVLLLTAATVLRRVERPIYGDGRIRRSVSTVLLFLAALMATVFVGLLADGSADPAGVAIALLLTLVLGASGLGLRGTRSFGSLRDNLALFGIGAVVIPLLVMLFVFSSSIEDNEIIMGDEEPEASEIAKPTGVVPTEVLVATVALMMGGVGAVWFWSRRAVAPMAEITAVANEIQAGSLDRRIDLRGGTREVRELADSFDQMLDRLATSSGTQQRMLEDASHELRTPLAALALNNELVLDADSASVADYRAAAERSQGLIDRLQTTIDELLLEGRAANHALQQIDNDLMAIVARVADQHRVLNPMVPVAIRGPQSLLLGIEGASVQRALINLVENAARYSPVGVPIEIDVATSDTTTLLSVTDHGPGIPLEQRDVIFERYYQADESVRGTAGIGLALVKQVADAHGGIDVVSPIDGDGGTRFTMTFRGPVRD